MSRLSRIFLFLILSAGLFAQTAQFPGAIAGDSQLGVAANNVQTSLSAFMGASDTTFTVTSGSQLKANMFVSIDSEIVHVCAVSTNTISVGISSCPNVDGRGFDNSIAATHNAGAAVTSDIDAWNFNQARLELEAIETFLGVNGANISIPNPLTVPRGGTGLSSGFQLGYLRVQPNTGNNTTLQFASLPANAAADYNFTPQAPGGTLTGGISATATMAPCPLGMNGSNTSYAVEIQGGTGTAEAPTVTGGTCAGGASSGTIIFTPANNHSGAWTVGPASGGLAEGICALPSTGGSVTVAAAITLLANVSACGKTDVSVTKLAGAAITGSFTVMGANLAGAVGTATINNTATPSVFNVTMYGADPSGSADSTTAFNNAISAAGTCNSIGEAPNGQCTVFMPAGKYKIQPITISGNLRLLGAGMQQTYLVPSTSGTTLLTFNGGGSPSNEPGPEASDFTVDLSSQRAMNGIDLNYIYYGRFSRVFVNYGANGFRLLNYVSTTFFDQVKTWNQSNVGFYAPCDTCGEIHLLNVEFEPPPDTTVTEQACFEVSRTTSSDQGAWYIDGIRCIGGGLHVNAGMVFTSSAAYSAINALINRATIDTITQGPALQLHNVTTIYARNSWFSCGSSSCPAAIQLDGTEQVEVSHSLTSNNWGPTVLIQAGSGASANLNFHDNQVNVGAGSYFLSLPATNQPTSIMYSGNAGLTVSQLTNLPSALLAATETQNTLYSDNFTIVGGGTGPALDLHDLVNNHASRITGSVGTFEFSNDINGGVAQISANGSYTPQQNGAHMNQAAANKDIAGVCTFASTTCTISFSTPYASAPSCTANDQTAAAPIKVAPTTTQLVLTGGSGAGTTDVVAYHCVGNPN